MRPFWRNHTANRRKLGAEMLIVRLPFPNPSLMPNRKNGTHWSKTNAAKERQFADARMLTLAALSVTGPQEWPERIPVSILYLSPDKRHRDADNLLAASKSQLDGIANALGVDDKRFCPILIDKALGDKSGAVIVGVGVQIVSSFDFSENMT